MTAEVHRVGVLGLGFGFFGAPLAWSVHLLVVYSLEEIACDAGFAGDRVLGVTAYGWLVVLATLAAALVGLAAALVSLRARRPSVEASTRAGDRYARTARFVGLGGLVLSGLFTLAILLAGVPAVVLEPCT